LLSAPSASTGLSLAGSVKAGTAAVVDSKDDEGVDKRSQSEVCVRLCAKYSRRRGIDRPRKEEKCLCCSEPRLLWLGALVMFRWHALVGVVPLLGGGVPAYGLARSFEQNEPRARTKTNGLGLRWTEHGVLLHSTRAYPLPFGVEGLRGSILGGIGGHWPTGNTAYPPHLSAELISTRAKAACARTVIFLSS